VPISSAQGRRTAAGRVLAHPLVEDLLPEQVAMDYQSPKEFFSVEPIRRAIAPRRLSLLVKTLDENECLDRRPTLLQRVDLETSKDFYYWDTRFFVGHGKSVAPEAQPIRPPPLARRTGKTDSRRLRASSTAFLSQCHRWSVQARHFPAIHSTLPSWFSSSENHWVLEIQVSDGSS
jgi:hypothetical protein